MDLWAEQRSQRRRSVEPLARRLRPAGLEDVLGQEHLLGPGRLLRRMIESDRLASLLFWGPPGTGKTTVAELIAARTRRHVARAHAAATGVREVRALLEDARRRLEHDDVRTLLIVDEIHRFARNQQDVLLADVEAGLVVLVGATTENPVYAINGPLLSRSTVLDFRPLDEAAVRGLLRRAIADPRAFPGVEVALADDAAALIARRSDGDARAALTALEVAVLSQTAEGVARVLVDAAVAADSMPSTAFVHDATGDEHYDVASAFIKSMRGSDADATVYWLARLLAAGEDPRFVARRIAILASEDIGNADPQALTVAASAWTVAERVGMPEARYALAQAALYMAAAPKSNHAARAIGAALEAVRDRRSLPVPPALRSGRAPDGTERRARTPYVSPHDDPEAAAKQAHLPEPWRFHDSQGESAESTDRVSLEPVEEAPPADA